MSTDDVEFKHHNPHGNVCKPATDTSKYSVEDLDKMCQKIADESKLPSPTKAKTEEDELDQINVNVQGIDIQREPSEEEVSSHFSRQYYQKDME